MKTVYSRALLAAAAMALATWAQGAPSDDWSAHCASCHGSDGAGKTKTGKKVGAKDLTDPAHQKEFTDDALFDHLKNGEKDPQGKVLMKPFSEKLSDDELHGLVAFVRTLAKQG